MTPGLWELNHHPVTQSRLRPKPGCLNSQCGTIVCYLTVVEIVDFVPRFGNGHTAEMTASPCLLIPSLLPGGRTVILLPRNHPPTFTGGRYAETWEDLSCKRLWDQEMICLEINLLGHLPTEGELLPPKRTTNLRGFSLWHVYLKLPGGSNRNEWKGKGTKTPTPKQKPQKIVMGRENAS